MDWGSGSFSIFLGIVYILSKIFNYIRTKHTKIMQIQPRLTSLQCQYSNILYMGILSVMMDCKSFILQQPIIRGQIIKN